MMRSPRTLMFAGLLMCCATAHAAGLTDQLDLASPAALKTHSFSSTGIVDHATAGDIVGEHDCRRPVLLIHPHASASFELHAEPHQSLTIEIESADDRDHDRGACIVEIDSVQAAIHTWESSGAGPAHWFVQSPLPARDHIMLRLRNISAAALRISRIWAFSSFDSYFDHGQFNVPFRIAPLIDLTGDDRKDLASLRSIRDSMHDQVNIRPAWTAVIGYANGSQPAVDASIDHVLALAEQSRLPVQICLNTWWAQTPHGSDGRGGHWTDRRYQQRIWNETKGQFQWSIPNQWSNTPWLTMNDADLNAFKVRRLRAAIAHLRLKLTDMNAAKKRSPVLSINLDNEPIYWASGSAGLGADLLWSDFNAATIAAAKKNGIALDPARGLPLRDRRWLWNNLLHYQSMIASAARDAIGNDLTQTDGDPLADNIYSQAMMMADPAIQFPMMNAAYPLWESAAPMACHIGGEWSRDDDFVREALAHQLPLGRSAATNVECENRVLDGGALRAAYALGMRYFTPYNMPLADVKQAAMLDDVYRPFMPMHFDPVLMEQTFTNDAWRKNVFSQAGVKRQLAGNTAAWLLRPMSSISPGQLTWKLTSRESAFDGLGIELSGRANDFDQLGRAVRIRVLAGTHPEPSSMREVGVIRDSDDLNTVHRVDLSEVARGRKSVFVRIELAAPGIGDSNLDWCGIWRLRFTTPWTDGEKPNLPEPPALREARRQSLLVSWRADAGQAIQRLGDSAQNVRAPAQQAFEQGEYARAYRIANEISMPSSCAPSTAP